MEGSKTGVGEGPRVFERGSKTGVGEGQRGFGRGSKTGVGEGKKGFGWGKDSCRRGSEGVRRGQRLV